MERVGVGNGRVWGNEGSGGTGWTPSWFLLIPPDMKCHTRLTALANTVRSCNLVNCSLGLASVTLISVFTIMVCLYTNTSLLVDYHVRTCLDLLSLLDTLCCRQHCAVCLLQILYKQINSTTAINVSAFSGIFGRVVTLTFEPVAFSMSSVSSVGCLLFIIVISFICMCACFT